MSDSNVRLEADQQAQSAQAEFMQRENQMRNEAQFDQSMAAQAGMGSVAPSAVPVPVVPAGPGVARFNAPPGGLNPALAGGMMPPGSAYLPMMGNVDASHMVHDGAMTPQTQQAYIDQQMQNQAMGLMMFTFTQKMNMINGITMQLVQMLARNSERLTQIQY